MIRVMASLGIIWGLSRDGEVTFEEELSYNYSYFQVRNLGTLVTSVTVITVRIWLNKFQIQIQTHEEVEELRYSSSVTPDHW